MRATRRWLQKAPRSQVIAIVDAWDVVVLAPIQTIARKFRAFGADVVISAELKFWPPDCNPSETQSYPPKTFRGHFEYANAGSVMGYAGALLEAFDFMAGENETFMCPDVCGGTHAIADDMRCFHHYWKSFARTGRVALDHNASIFLSMNDVPAEGVKIIDEGRRVHYAPTGENPCVLHFNGNGKQQPRSNTFFALAEMCFSEHPQYAVRREDLRIT